MTEDTAMDALRKYQIALDNGDDVDAAWRNFLAACQREMQAAQVGMERQAA